MKFIKSPKGAVTTLLILLLIVSCFWIVKSEIRAASLQSQLEEHHKQLKGNSDVLDGLVTFFRGTKGGSFAANENLAYMIADLASITLKDDKVEIETPGEIEIGNGKDIRFGYDKKKDIIYMINKGSKFNIGTLWKGQKEEDFGAGIQTKSGTIFHVRDKGIGAWVTSDDGEYALILSSNKNYVELKKGNSKVRFEGDSIDIEAPGDINIKTADDIRFGYDKKKDIIYMINKGSKFNIGTLWKGQKEEDFGAGIQTKSGTIFHVRDKGIGAWVTSDDGEYALILSSNKNYVELKKSNSKVRFEGDNINIEAVGDINITSKNGKVNINGKR